MFKNIVRFSLISLLNILIVSTAGAQNDWLVFRNTQFNFRFLYPPNWHISTPRGPNVRGSVIAPNNKPFANCAIVVRQVPELCFGEVYISPQRVKRSLPLAVGFLI